MPKRVLAPHTSYRIPIARGRPFQAGQSAEGRKQFFFEKKAAPALREPKNFCLWGARLRPERGNKSFLLLFFKKEGPSLAFLPSPDCPAVSGRSQDEAGTCAFATTG
jgi:hypothetical protein